MSFNKQSYVCRNWFAERGPNGEPRRIRYLWHDGVRVFQGVAFDFDGSPIVPPVISRVSLFSQDQRLLIAHGQNIEHRLEEEADQDLTALDAEGE